jgi:hypothetical protein
VKVATYVHLAPTFLMQGALRFYNVVRNATRDLGVIYAKDHGNAINLVENGSSTTDFNRFQFRRETKFWLFSWLRSLLAPSG